MHFYNQHRRFYGGVDLHARNNFRPVLAAERRPMLARGGARGNGPLAVAIADPKVGAREGPAHR